MLSVTINYLQSAVPPEVTIEVADLKQAADVLMDEAQSGRMQSFVIVGTAADVAEV